MPVKLCKPLRRDESDPCSYQRFMQEFSWLDRYSHEERNIWYSEMNKCTLSVRVLWSTGDHPKLKRVLPALCWADLPSTPVSMHPVGSLRQSAWHVSNYPRETSKARIGPAWIDSCSFQPCPSETADPPCRLVFSARIPCGLPHTMPQDLITKRVGWVWIGCGLSRWMLHRPPHRLLLFIVILNLKLLRGKKI